MANQSSDQVESLNASPDERIGTSRRRLLKGVATAAPLILTIRSGAALAQSSGCLDVVSNTQTFPLTPNPPDGYTCLNDSGSEVAFTPTDNSGDGTADVLQCNANLVTASSAASLGAGFCT